MLILQRNHSEATRGDEDHQRRDCSEWAKYMNWTSYFFLSTTLLFFLLWTDTKSENYDLKKDKPKRDANGRFTCKSPKKG